MVDAGEFRQTFAAFLGEERYQKFVWQGLDRGRLRFWQEEEWDRFTAAHPEYAVGLKELAAILRFCVLHGQELLPDTVEVHHGFMDYAPWYIEVRNRLFPYAASDTWSTEGAPFEGERIGVWYCPACRQAKVEWEAKR